MDKCNFGKKILSQWLVMMFIFTSCMPSSQVRTGDVTDGSAATTSGSGNGNGATEGDTTVGGGTTLPPTVEIRHLIEPNLSSDSTYTTGTGQAAGGSYVRKLTLPKNFAGRLYLAGINIASLNSSFVKVRFRFGVGRQALSSDIPATIMKAPGITPSTSISVLAMDLRSQPFRNVRLSYDLFDYNSYDTDGMELILITVRHLFKTIAILIFIAVDFRLLMTLPSPASVPVTRPMKNVSMLMLKLLTRV